MMEYCGLCKCEVKDWVKHTKSSEHQIKSRLVIKK
jgi:hypothetical protein